MPKLLRAIAYNVTAVWVGRLNNLSFYEHASSGLPIPPVGRSYLNEMPKKEDCIDCIHCKSLNEKQVYCRYDDQAHPIDENHCAASDWAEFSSARIRHLAETINKVENTMGYMKLGKYYRCELINLRREKKLRSQ